MRRSRSLHPDVLRFPHPVLKAVRLKKGKIRSFSIFGRNYVLFRDASGTPVAAPAACPHRGASLSQGKVNARGELECGYHAWRICSDGTATSAAVPNKTCRVDLLKTWERHGYIWVAHADVPDAAFPEFIDPRYRLVAGFTTPFLAPLRVVVDNFAEIEHAFRVHTFVGPSAKHVDSVKFRTESTKEESTALSSARYRRLPLGLSRMFGVYPGDDYHNDWTFKFKPLQGNYRNYWTAAAGEHRRPVSFVITTFFVATSDNRVDLHTFLQVAIESRFLRLLRPLLHLVSNAIVRFEIWADARIARFAPESPEVDGQNWQLTGLDKQVIVNRRLMDEVYFGETPGRRALPLLSTGSSESSAS